MKKVRCYIVSIVALTALSACSPQNDSSSSSTVTHAAPTDGLVLNAGPRKAPPEDLNGKKWKSRPTHDLKQIAPPTDGIAVYVPTGSLASLEGIPVAEADLEYDKGQLWRGDLYIDGAERRDAVRNALLKLYGSPDPQPTTGNDYSWSWPKRHIAVDMRFDGQHARTTVDFSSATKSRSTDDVPGSTTPPSQMDAWQAEDMSKVAQNMKLAILDGNRNEACSNAKSLYYDGLSLSRRGVINPTQKKAAGLAEQFIRDQCPR